MVSIEILILFLKPEIKLTLQLFSNILIRFFGVQYCDLQGILATSSILQRRSGRKKILLAISNQTCSLYKKKRKPYIMFDDLGPCKDAFLKLAGLLDWHVPYLKVKFHNFPALKTSRFLSLYKGTHITNKRTNGPVAHLRDFLIVRLKGVLISDSI